MEREQLIEVIPHFLALVILLFLVLFLVRTLVGEVGFWVELLIAFGIAVVYRPLVKRLGVAPEIWK